MSWLKKTLKKAAHTVSNPVRGIGRIARGNVRAGLRDIGSSVKTLSPALAFVPGVGTAAALGIGALGGGLAAKKGAGIGDVAKGAAGGAAGAYAGTQLKSALPGIRQGIGQLASRGGAAGAEIAGAGAGAGAGGGGMTAMAMPAVNVGGAGAGAAGAGGAGGTMAGIGNVARGAGNVAQNVGGAVLKHGATAAQLAGVGAQAYGAQQEGKAMDRQLDFQEEGTRRDWARDEELDPYRRMMLERMSQPRQSFDDWRGARA